MTPEQAYSSYLAAVLAGDRRGALQVADHARAAGLELATLYIDVFQATLRELGRLWQENALTVAQEHLATAITQAAMVRLYHQELGVHGGGPTLVAACAETERHEIGLRMICDLLDLQGWETVFLGASVPTESLVAMLSAHAADVLALSAAIDPHLPQLQVTIRAVRQTLGPARPLILVGGRPFLQRPDLAASLGADLTARDAVEAAATLAERFR